MQLLVLSTNGSVGVLIFPPTLSLLKFIISAKLARGVPTGRAFVPGLLGHVSPDPTSQCSNDSEIALKTLELVYYRRTGKRFGSMFWGLLFQRRLDSFASILGVYLPQLSITLGSH